MTIQVYQAEQVAGIADMVAKGSISFASSISDGTTKLNKDELNVKFHLAKSEANPNQLDLYYKHSVLASVGWNKNDDVFDKLHTWKARNSVADKQLNLGHNEMDIIGHMTDSYVLDAQGNVIPDDTPEDKIPDKFDVISEFVLYKLWANEDRIENVKNIIADIEAGKGYVSMECRFPAFDYAIIDKDGNHKTVARTAETAFLSQHLRAFGGTGEYQGYKVGRLLKDFFFTGQGVVANPANERSIIFDIGSKPFTSKGSIQIRDNTMDEKQIQALVAELAAAKAKLAEQEAAKASELAELAKTATRTANELAAAKTALEGELTTVKAAVTSKETAIAGLTEELKTAAEKVKIAEAEVAAMKAESKKTARASKLIEAGVEADKVEATLTKWASLSDEQFADIVAMFPPKKKDDKKDDGDKDDAKAQTKVEADLAKAEVETPKVGNGGGSDAPSRGQSMASFLAAGLPYSASASARIAKENK